MGPLLFLKNTFWKDSSIRQWAAIVHKMLYDFDILLQETYLQEKKKFLVDTDAIRAQ